MANILQMLAGLLGGEQQPTNALAAAGQGRVLRPGGLDTPAGGGAVTPFAAPQPVAAPAVDSMPTASTPSPAPSGGGLGGFVQGLFGGGEQKGYNDTVQWLRRSGYDEGQAMMIAKDKPTLQKVLLSAGGNSEYVERAKAASQFGIDQNSPEFKSFVLTGKMEGGGDEYNKRATAALKYGLKQGTPEFENFVLSGDLPSARGGAAEIGLNIVYAKDKDGNLKAFQPSKGGGLIPANLPEGYTFEPGTGKIDLGTEWGITDRSGAVIQRVPKDLAGAEADKAAGKARGEASFDLPRVEQNAEQTLGILERMKTHPGREGSTGFIQGMLPSRNSDQVDFQSLVDQTQGQSFLQAFQMLKGGGQITEIEGAKATNAISRLGNQRISDKEYLQAITDLEEVVKNGLARARRQAGSLEPEPGRFGFSSDAPSGGNQTKTGVKWSVK